MSGTEAESDRRQRESCVLMKAKPPTLTLAGREHIASAADNVRLPTKRVAKEPQQADHALLDSEIRGMSASFTYIVLRPQAENKTLEAVFTTTEG
jgi:hypothetical protein